MSFDPNDLGDKERALLWRMAMFCAEWEGKVIAYRTALPLRRDKGMEKGLVLGHDGPHFFEGEDGGWRRHTSQHGVLLGGWGCVVIMKQVGITHCTDPANIVEVREIRRDALAHTRYEAEATDLFCPYGCNERGLLKWNQNWSGPEYEVFCPVHAAEAHELGRDLYFGAGFDGGDPEAEQRYYDLTKVAYAV